MSINKITKSIFLSFFAIVLTAAIVIVQFDNIDHEIRVTLPETVHNLDQNIKQQESATPLSIPALEVLGFDSKFGVLPNSLDGTQLDTQLETTEDGHLIISDDIKYIFDYFLSTINEEELDKILLRIDEYLNHYLVEPALGESKIILAQYIDLKTSLFELEQEMGAERADLVKDQLAGGQYLELLRDRLNRRNALRAEYLEPEVNEIFYEEEEAYDEYTYSRLLLNIDKSLSPEERNLHVVELQQMLPEDIQQSMRKSQIIDELTVETNKILAAGGDQQQVHQLRKEMFGEEAAQRFDTLDQKRAQWKIRMDNFLAERTKILNTEGLPQEELILQVNTLREAHFDTSEQMKAQVYEKRAGA